MTPAARYISSDAMATLIDSEIRSILHEGRATAYTILSEHYAQLTKLAALRQSRDNGRVLRALDRLQAAALSSDNLMAPILEAVRAYATLGEMCDALREVWGEYEEVPII